MCSVHTSLIAIIIWYQFDGCQFIRMEQGAECMNNCASNRNSRSHDAMSAQCNNLVIWKCDHWHRAENDSDRRWPTTRFITATNAREHGYIVSAYYWARTDFITFNWLLIMINMASVRKRLALLNKGMERKMSGILFFYLYFCSRIDSDYIPWAESDFVVILYSAEPKFLFDLLLKHLIRDDDFLFFRIRFVRCVAEVLNNFGTLLFLITEQVKTPVHIMPLTYRNHINELWFSLVSE